MAAAIVEGATIEVATLEEQAAGALARAAEDLLALGEDEDSAYKANTVTVNCLLPDHEYVSSRDYTRIEVNITPRIVARAKEIVEELMGNA